MKREIVWTYSRKFFQKAWFLCFFLQEIVCPKLYELWLNALKEWPLFFCILKEEKKATPGFWIYSVAEVCIIISAGFWYLGKNTEIIPWDSKRFDKKINMALTRICLVWPGWYPCGSSDWPKEDRDTINLKF